jgi:o-succinylbenzoate synthase
MTFGTIASCRRSSRRRSVWMKASSPRHARYALEMEACKIINIKPARVGGLSQGIAIHDYCLERNVPVWCGGMLETGVGRASNLRWLHCPGLSCPGIFPPRTVIISATLRTSVCVERRQHDRCAGRPGLGVTIDEGALKNLRFRKSCFGSDV